jgi:hypothetical protein
VGAEPHEFEGIAVGLAVDQHQVGLYMAVPIILPIASESMITVLFGQRLVAAKPRTTVSRS